MGTNFKPLINKKVFYSILEEFREKGWTTEGKAILEKLHEYLNNHEGVIYDTNYANVDALGINRQVWSTGEFIVPDSRRGHLKKYRGYKVLIVVLHQPDGYKRTIGCYPIEKVNVL